VEQQAAKHEAHLVDIQGKIQQRVPMDQIVLRPRTMDVVDGGSPERTRRPKSAAKFYVDSADYDQMLGGDGRTAAAARRTRRFSRAQCGSATGLWSTRTSSEPRCRTQRSAIQTREGRGCGPRSC